MPVRLGGVSKQARGNHRPQFRPTDDDTLRLGAAGIGRAIGEAMRLIPNDVVEQVVLGGVDRVDATELFLEAMEPAREKLERAIYRVYLDEQADMSARIRREVNADLRRLGSPVRLHDPRDIEKAPTIRLPWSVDAPNFDRVADTAPGKVLARGRAAGVLSRIALDEQRVVFDQVARAFTDTQVFSTGRQVVGRTVAQTARSIVPILAATTGAQMNLSPAEVALYRSRYTNGLFPKWALAVNNFADAQAGALAAKGVTGARAQIIVDKRTRAYSDKLRRSRARMIARTEVNIVQNRAQIDAMLDAQQRGLIGSRARKEWVTGPFDVCPICTALGGTQVRLTESFPNVGDSPPAHPNCRCIVRLVPNLDRAPERLGAGTPDDPFRYRFGDGWEAPITPVRGFGPPRVPRQPAAAEPPPLPPPQPTPSVQTADEALSEPPQVSDGTANADIVWDAQGRRWADLTSDEQEYLTLWHVDSQIRAVYKNPPGGSGPRGGATLTRLPDGADDAIREIRRQQEELNDLIAAHEAGAVTRVFRAHPSDLKEFPGREMSGFKGQPPNFADPDAAIDVDWLSSRISRVADDIQTAAPPIEDVEAAVSRLGKAILAEAERRGGVAVDVVENQINRRLLKEGRYIGDVEAFTAARADVRDSIETLSEVLRHQGAGPYSVRRWQDLETSLASRFRNVAPNDRIEELSAYVDGWQAMWTEAARTTRVEADRLWRKFAPDAADLDLILVGPEAVADATEVMLDAAMDLVAAGTKTVDEVARFIDNARARIASAVSADSGNILRRGLERAAQISVPAVRDEATAAINEFWGRSLAGLRAAGDAGKLGQHRAVLKALERIADPATADDVAGWAQALGVQVGVPIRDEVQSILHAIRGFGDETFAVADDINVFNRKSMSAKASAPHVEQLNRVVAEWMPDDWVARSNARGRLGMYRRGSRAHYVDAAGTGTPGDGLINVGRSGQLADSTMLHEVTHRAQQQTVLHGDLEEAWVRRRTKPPKGLEGDPRYTQRRLKDIYPGSGYANHEVAIEDEFFSAYIGRSYSGKHHESSSMAIERVAGLTPQGARKRGYGSLLEDVDMAEWMIGMLAGT